MDLGDFLDNRARKLDDAVAESERAGYSTNLRNHLLLLAHDMRIQARRCRELASDCVVT